MRLRATRLTSIAQAGGQRTLIQRAIAVLRRFGQDAHVYLPGVGMLNGLQAANYIDSAGTQVGAVDQPVGLALDAAGGLGVELIADSGIDSDAFWGKGAGWSVSGGVATRATAGSFSNLSPVANTLLTIGKTYVASVNIVSISGDALIFAGMPGCPAFTTSGLKQFVFAATGSAIFLQATGAATNAVVDSFSVREVTGIAASQPTTASKPILRRGAVNLLTYSGDFSNAAWTKIGAGTITYNEIGPNGAANSAATITTTTTAVRAILRASGNYVIGSTGMPLTAAIYIKKTSGVLSRYPVVAIEEIAANRMLCIATVDTTNGLLTNWSAYTAFTINSGYASSIVSVGDYWLVTISGFALGVTSCSIEVYPVGAPTSTQSSGVITGAIGPDVVVGTCCMFQGTYTAAQIQALGGIPLTTTAPASTALGPQYWQFDGSNDSLALGGPLFQMADDHCVIAGVSCQASSSWRTIFSQGGVSAVPRIQMVIDAGDGKAIGYWRDDVGANVNLLGATDLRNKTSVVCMSKVGINRSLRVNTSALASSATTLGATTLSNYAIGVLNGADWMTGAIYPVIAIKGTVPDADLLLLEKFVGQMSGVSI